MIRTHTACMYGMAGYGSDSASKPAAPSKGKAAAAPAQSPADSLD